MSTPDRLITTALRRPDANPLWRGLDPEVFRLYAEFVQSHGWPRGELTTLFSPGTLGTISGLRRDEASRK
jgi:hypothetical protein